MVTNDIIFSIIFCIIIIYFYKHLKKKNRENFVNISIPNIATYLINLDQSKDRLEYITKRFKEANIKFIRFNAINGKKLNLKKIYKNGTVSAKWLKRGQIGVAMSHITLWKTLRNWEEDIAIIFEDDVIIPKNFWILVKQYMKQLPKDWDMFFLGGTSVIGSKYSKNLLVPAKESTKGIYNTGFFAYMVNKKCLDTLIEKSKPLVTAIDNQIKDFAFKYLNVFYAYPGIVSHNYEFESTNNKISNNIGYFISTQYLKKARKITLL
tara:strand:- start:9 stop:803 length:795 start_codon:yes stop_codon:yes gene_type:complete